MDERAFFRLRLRLTALYSLAMVGFLAITGVIVYAIISGYFQSSTDLALRSQMGRQFELLNLPIPAELLSAHRQWEGMLGRPGIEMSYGRESEDHERRPVFDRSFSGELASVLVAYVDSQDRYLTVGNNTVPLFTLDTSALTAAKAHGSDLRTVSSNGSSLRVLTYSMPPSAQVAAVQVARPMTEQDSLLRQLLAGLLIGGGALAALATLASWWLAGRSLRPMQDAWDRQRMFVANASHELRTPLSMVQLSAEVAARDDTSDTERKDLSHDVLRESHYMTRLIGDLLLMSRMDAGQLKLDVQDVAVASVFDDARRDVARLADERGITIDVRPTTVHVPADASRLRQVLLVLLDNALRHTPEGGQVTLSAAVHGKWVDLAVADTGSGVAPEHLPRIFDRFYRVDSARSTRSTGLGLSIALDIMRQHGGTIDVTSKLGDGSTFTLRLPATAHRTN